MGAWFRKKRAAAPTTVHPELRAELRPEEAFPPTPPDEHGADCRDGRSRLHAEGDPPALRLFADPDVSPTSTAFVVPGSPGGKDLAFRNRPDALRFEVLRLGPGDETRPAERAPEPDLDPDQARWKGFFVHDVAPLPAGRVLVVVNCYTPKPRTVLYLYEAESSVFSRLTDAEPSLRDLASYFDCRRPSPDTAVVVHYSNRVRESAEIYHNYENHVRVFTPDHPEGLEALRLGIDTGNILEWAVRDRTLHLRTVDPRGRKVEPERCWSLDLSAVLPAGGTPGPAIP